MNARERAKKIAILHRDLEPKGDIESLAMAIEQAITAAEEEKAKEEREAIIQIIDADIEEWEKWTNNEKPIRELMSIKNKIRARSEGKNRDKCIMLGCEKPVASPEPFARYCQDHALPKGEKKGE